MLNRYSATRILLLLLPLLVVITLSFAHKSISTENQNNFITTVTNDNNDNADKNNTTSDDYDMINHPTNGKIFHTMQLPLNATTIPVGFRGSVDSSGIYSILYHISESNAILSSTTSSNGMRKKSYVLEAMIFRQSDFRNGVPTVSQRVPIQKLSVEIRYSNIIPTRTRILSDQLLAQGNINHDVNSVANVPISFGDQTQISYVMKPVTDFLFILPEFTIPDSPRSTSSTTNQPQTQVLILFSAVVVPTTEDIATFRRAIAQGAMPASENPFYSAQLRINSIPPTTSTVTTIVIRSTQWISINLANASSKPAYARLNADVTQPITSGSFSIIREQFDDLEKVTDIITTLPDQQTLPSPRWPVFESGQGRFYHMLYSYRQFQSTTNTLNNDPNAPKATFVPSFYAPRQLLPLSSSNPNNNNNGDTSNMMSNAAINAFNRLNNQFTSSTTLIAVTTPSNMPITGSASNNDSTTSNETLIKLLSSPSTTVAFPIQLRLVPYTIASTQFTLPQYTIAMWPKFNQEFEWVDIQIQAQLVRLSTHLGESNNNNNPTTLLDMNDVSRNMGAMSTTHANNNNHNNNSMSKGNIDDEILNDEHSHNDNNTTISINLEHGTIKMYPFQSSPSDPNPIDPDIASPIISESLSPTVVSSDLTQGEISQILQRVVNPTQWEKGLPTMRYAMATLNKDNDGNTNNNNDNNVENNDHDGIVEQPTTDEPTRTPGNQSSTPTARWTRSAARQLHHFDYNLYALRANATNHNNNVEYAIVLFYQFIGKPTERNNNSSPPRPNTNPQLMISDWVPFITKLPTINQTLSSTFFPFDPILPNLNSVAFSSTTPTPNNNNNNNNGSTTIIPLIPNDTTRGSTPRTTLQPIRVNERVDLTTTEVIVGNPVSGNVPVRNPTTGGTITNPATTTPDPSSSSPTTPNGPISGTPTTGTTPIVTPTGPGNINTVPTSPPPTTTTPTPRPQPTTGGGRRFQAVYPVSPLYSTIGYNVTWFLTKHNPSSPYLFRHDVIPASLREESLETSLFSENLKNPSKDDFSNNLFVVEAIPSIAIRFIAEVLDVKINIHINDVYQGTWNMKLVLGDGATVKFPSGVYNDIDGDGIRDSPALHNTDPQAYIRPFNGERWMSPVIQLHPNDLLGYSFTYQLRPFAKYIPEWANPRDPSYQTQVATTTTFNFAGAKSFVHAILPIETSSPDPAQLISSPSFKYSIKIRTTIPTTKTSLSFTTGRISAQDGGLLGLPPIDPGVCYSTSQHLPLRGRFNVFMRLEFMPVSILPLSPTAATRDSEGTLQSGFTATLPADLRGGGSSTAADVTTTTTTMTAIINYVLSTLPPLLEDWWYFDGLIESTSSLLTADDYHATFAAALDIVAPFPDPDPGLRLRATPSEELLLYAFTIWPQHNENDISTSSALVYSPDTFTSSGRAMGFQQCYPLHSVCF